MSELKIYGLGNVITEPFVRNAIKPQAAVVEQFKMVGIENNKNSLTWLKIISVSIPRTQNEEVLRRLNAGDFIGVPGTSYAQPWAKEVHETEDGVKYIIVPLDAVRVVKMAEYNNTLDF
jgi:hypothetical protein